MGSTITVPQDVDSVQFDVKVWDDEPITKLELISIGGTVLAQFEPRSPENTEVTWYPPPSAPAYLPYVFLRVTTEDKKLDMPGQATNVAYTAPIWIQYQ